MLWQIDRKLQRILTDLDTYRIQTEDMFKEKLTTEMTKNTENRLETIKNTKFSPPTSLDPAGIVNKLEHVLDNTENKFTRFI